MKKVALPKEVAEAIEYATRVHSSLTNVLDDVFNCGGGSDYRMNLLAKHFADDEKGLMSALVNGYEIEKTPEDRIREYYEDRRKSSQGSIYWAQAEAVKTLLGILGIKIEGVNA